LDNALIVEILLGVLAAAVGWAGYQGSKSANKTQAVTLPDDVEADAYERARNIYEGAIGSLEAQVRRLREELTILDREVNRLRESNVALLGQVDELRTYNRQLLVQSHEMKETNDELMSELRELRGTA
jgi:chromosome segregation ATPase